jgi:hypothetical protein
MQQACSAVTTKRQKPFHVKRYISRAAVRNRGWICIYKGNNASKPTTGNGTKSLNAIMYIFFLTCFPECAYASLQVFSLAVK